MTIPPPTGPKPAVTPDVDAHVPPPPTLHFPVDWHDLRERLRRLALALTRRPDQADDLVQQTLSALLTKAPTTRPTSPTPAQRSPASTSISNAASGAPPVAS